METLYSFLLGVVVVAAGTIGLFFLRFWRRTRDRLFFVFAIAFWLMALNWFAVAFTPKDESFYAVYLLRLLAFGFIIAGIIDKNRAARPRVTERRPRQPT
jgi:hypothetical protein